MTDKQPEALRLADAITHPEGEPNWETCVKAAAELRRLHEVNAELLEALRFIAEHNLEGTDDSVATIIAGMLIYHAKDALAKATGEQQ
jgi:hypothetical protein